MIIDIAPWGYIQNRQITGIYADIAAEIDQRVSDRALPDLVPYSRAQAALNHHPFNFTIMTRSEEIIARGGVAVAEIMRLNVVLLSLPQHRFERLSDLRGLSVAKVRGTHLSPRLEADRSIKLREPPNTLQQMRLLLAGRAAAALGVPEDFSFTARHLTQLGQPVPGRWETLSLRTLPVMLWVPATAHEARIEELKNAVMEMRSDGIIERYRHLPRTFLDTTS